MTVRAGRSAFAAVLGAMLVTVVTVACQSAPGGSQVPTGAPTGLTTLPSGIPLITSGPPGPGSTSLGTPKAVALDLPPAWRGVELTDAGINAAIADVGAANPAAAAALRQLLQGGQLNAIRFYGLGLSGSKVIGTVNVSTAKFGELSLETSASLYAEQIVAAGATQVATTRVSLPAGDGAVVNYKLTTATSAGPVTGRSYLVLREGWGYVTTFSCFEPNPAACLADADATIRTLRIGP